MKNFTDDAIKTAKERTQKLIVKFGSMKPSEDFTRDEIRSTMFYLEDYFEELKSLEYDRKLRRMGYKR